MVFPQKVCQAKCLPPCQCVFVTVGTSLMALCFFLGKTISFGALQARYVRYYSSRNNRNTGVHFLELEVWNVPSISNVTCVDCESGKYSQPGSTVCEDCGAHSTSESGSSACMCTAGYTRTSEGCVACEIGTFKNYAGNDPCTPHCPPGTFVSLSNATSAGTPQFVRACVHACVRACMLVCCCIDASLYLCSLLLLLCDGPRVKPCPSPSPSPSLFPSGVRVCALLC